MTFPLLKILKVAGTVTGALKVKDDGTPVTSRKKRLVATGIILAGAIAAWLGMPPEVAAALVDFLTVAAE